MRQGMGRDWRIAAAVLVALLAGLWGPQAVAQSSVTTPAPGSPIRAEILNAVRGIAVGELGGPIEFVVNDIRVLGEWAFVVLHPQRPGGGEIFYTYTRYQAAWDAGALDQQLTALLRQTPAGWLIYEYNFGATDVVWIDWIGRYPAPIEVFPPTGP
jgi:hypothetical protein